MNIEIVENNTATGEPSVIRLTFGNEVFELSSKQYGDANSIFPVLQVRACGKNATSLIAEVVNKDGSLLLRNGHSPKWVRKLL